MVEDDEEKTGKIGGPTSMESEISAIPLQSPHLREQPKTHGCLSPPTTEPIIKPTLSSGNRPISPSIALYRDPVEQAIRGGDHEAAATIYSLHAIIFTYLFPSNLKTKEI